MYPQPAFLNGMLNIVQTILIAIGGLIALYLFIIFIPLFIRILLEMIISIVRSQLRFDIRPILDLLFFPGSMLRVTVMWYTLSFFGFKYRLSFILPDAGESASNANYRYRGLSYYSYQENTLNNKSHLKMAFILSLASYQVLVFVVVLLMFRSSIIISMYFFLPAHLVLPIFNFFIFTLIFGGMPVPEETLSVLYGLIYTAPHVVLALLINIIATLIIAPYVGVVLAMFFFTLTNVVNIYTAKILGNPNLNADEEFEIMHNYIGS